MTAPVPGLEQPKAPPARLRSAAGKLAASLLITAGFVWAFKTGGVPIFPDAELLARVSPWAVAAYALCYVLCTALRPYRWSYVLRTIAPQLSTFRVIGIGLVGYTAIFLAPLRMGEIVRPWLLADDGEVTFMQAAGTVAAERIIDGLVLTLFLITSLLSSHPLPNLPNQLGEWKVPLSAVPATAYMTCAVFASAFLLLVMFYRWRALARRLVQASVGLVSSRLADWLSLRVERLSDGLKFLPSRKSGAFVRDSVLYWLATILGAWLLLRGVGIDASFAQSGVVIGVMGIGTLVPSGPGFFGVFQAGAYVGLRLFFPETTVFHEGAVFAFIGYCAQVALTSISGLIGAAILVKTKPR